jgi:hypothetical protein
MPYDAVPAPSPTPLATRALSALRREMPMAGAV